MICKNIVHLHDTCWNTFIEYTTTHSPAAVKILIFEVFCQLTFPIYFVHRRTRKKASKQRAEIKQKGRGRYDVFHTSCCFFLQKLLVFSYLLVLFYRLLLFEMHFVNAGDVVCSHFFCLCGNPSVDKINGKNWTRENRPADSSTLPAALMHWSFNVLCRIRIAVCISCVHTRYWIPTKTT